MGPEVNSNRFENSNRFKNCSVYMAISLRATLKSQAAFKNYFIYMEISLRQLSKPLQDPIVHEQMISFN